MNKALRAMLDSVGLGLPDLTMPDFSGLTPAQTAQRLRKSFYRASRAAERDAPDLAEVSALTVDGAMGALPGRLYTPLGAGIGPGPGIVFFHGGGFVLGDLDSHDMICRRLADASRCRVLSVDYRLAPEHKFPAAHADAEASWRWAIERAELLNMDPERIAVAGDSAGGNLAAFLCQEMSREDGPLPALQLLFYPLMQFVDIRAKKMSFQEGGFFISPNMFDYFRDAYVGRETDRTDKRVSPLFAPEEDFAGLPPAYVMLCGWDPLRDEGRVYANKLESHGVPVTVKEHLSMVHGFLNLTSVSKVAREAVREAGEFAGRTLGARK
ncbi:MAG: alpha/beta hydrolase [Pseudomonadota bacterium]